MAFRFWWYSFSCARRNYYARVFSALQIEIDLTFVAAILSVVGYSINDSIVVFDRVRENFRKIRRLDTIDIIDISLTQTLSRTIITSVTTLVVVMALFFFGILPFITFHSLYS